MILECDIGNTRCKWRVLDSKGVEQSGSFHHQQGFEDLGAIKRVDRARVAGVASVEVHDKFTRQLKSIGLEAEFAVSSADVAGVINGYEEPAKLGVDRWLAIVAAYKRKQRAVLVLDAGSALTVDLVDESGRHLGGYILPGIELMRTSLLSNTGGVRFDLKQQGAGLVWGKTTATAVNAGVLVAQVGAVQLAIELAGRQLCQDFAILLTGGDAREIIVHLPSELGAKIEVVPELVLDGLAWVLP